MGNSFNMYSKSLSSILSDDGHQSKGRPSQVNHPQSPHDVGSITHIEHDMMFMKKLRRKFISLQQEKVITKNESGVATTLNT